MQKPSTKLRSSLSLATLAFTALLVYSVRPLAAQAPRILFDRISIEHGLSQNSVNTVYQDRQGFMWFGTEDGLNRYDGYSFQIFRHDPQNPSSLSRSMVLTILQVRDGTLWVGTHGGGLNRWNPRDETFTRLTNNPANPTTLSNDRVWVIFEDREGVLWIGTDGGLNRFDPQQRSFTRFNHNPGDPDSLGHDWVRSIHEDQEGTLWVGTLGGGLDRMDRTTGKFTHYRHDPRDPASLSDDRVRAIAETGRGELWIGTLGGGLNRFDRSSETFTRFRHDPRDRSSLSDDRVRTICEDSEGVLWIGTEIGLNRWRPDTEGFFHYRHDPGDASSLSGDVVAAVFQDRGGVLWIGTKAGGLSKWNVSAGFFPHFRHDPEDPSSLTSNIVTSFSEDASGVLWIGTFGGGLDRFDRTTGLQRNYRHDPRQPQSISDDQVMSLLSDSGGTLWIGTFQGGLNRLRKGSDSFVRYRYDAEDPGSLGADGVMAIFEDRDGLIWVGTFDGGLSRFDRASDSFIRYQHDPANATTLSSDRVTSFYEDRSGLLWVGTEGGGLNRFDRGAGTFTHYRSDPSIPTTLSSDVIYSIHETSDGVLWIGTQAGGLNRWEPTHRERFEGVFQRYTEQDGLPNDSVYGILEDEGGNLWLSTNRGLSRFDPRSERFRNYDVKQGLQSNEFNFGAYYKSPEGELYFGGINGFNVFRPELIRDNTRVPPVVLTGFLKLNQPVRLDRPLYEVERVEISYRDPVISFQFAALDYTAPEKNAYSYKLEGFDQDWIENGNLRRATYTNLNPGRYTFRVRGSNNDGVWDEEGTALRVRVIPPPWRSWWAYTLYVILAAGLVYAYTRSQARKLEREAEYRRMLELEVAARTRELEERNEQLEQANRGLEEASLTDSLTGLRNRRFVVAHIEEEMALAERRHEALQKNGKKLRELKPDFLFLMFDLDGLKQLNDNYGHSTGDLLLCQIRDLLERICRKSDTVVRWGGDEFLIMGRDANLDAAELLAERVRKAIAEHEFDLDVDQPIHISCSLGFAFYPFAASRPELINWEQALAIADRALYAAKKSGRNAWVGLFCASEEPPDNLFKRIYDAPEHTLAEGVVRAASSLELDKLSWGSM